MEKRQDANVKSQSAHDTSSTAVMSKSDENIYRWIVEHTQEGILMVDLSGVITYANQRMGKLLGYDVHDLTGRSIFDFIFEQDIPQFRKYLQEYRKIQTYGEHDVRFRRSDGSELWTLISLTPIHNPDGELTGLLGMFTDITDRKKTEQSLLESEARLKAIIESIPFDFWFMDNEGRYSLQNSVCATHWGNVIGRTLDDLPIDEAIKSIWRKNNHQVMDGRMVHEEIQYSINNQKRFFSNTAAPVISGDRLLGILGLNMDITEHKLMEEALKDSEAKFRALVENANDPIGIVQGTKLIYANPCFVSISEYTEEELLTMDIALLVHPEDRNLVLDRALRRQRGEQLPSHYEHRMITKHGKLRWMELSVARVELGGKPALIGIAHDVTDRRQTQDALQKSNEGLKLLAEMTNRLLIDEDPTQVIESLCLRILPIIDCDLFLNYLADEDKKYLRLNVYGGISTETAQAIEQVDYGVGVCGWAARGAQRVISEFIQQRVDPRTDLLRPLGVRCYASSPLFSREGRVMGTLSFGSRTKDRFSEEDLALIQAVTDQVAVGMERVRIESALRQSEEQLRIILQNTPAIVYMIDGDNRLRYINRRYEELLGLKNKEIRGRSVYEIFPEENASVFVTNDRMVLEKRVPMQFEERVPHPDGSIHVYTSVKTPFFDDQGRTLGVVGVSTDITDRKRGEENLKQWNEQLEERVQERTRELNRTVEDLKRSNEDLERFAYISSHDLQEPLRMIASYVGLLEYEYKSQLDTTAREYIHYAVEGAKRMSSLIKDLLEYSRVNTRGKPLEPTDCEKVLDQVLRQLQVKIQETHAVVKHDPLPTILADETQLSQVFQNLIDNAIKFHKKDEPPQIYIKSDRQNGYWLFSVRDNGIGIDKQYQDKIFVLFQRLHADRGKYPGTGIGLAIVKRIIERHGGQVRIDSKPNEGSTFYFTLPSCKEKENT